MNRAAFFSHVRSKLGRLSQKQVDGFEIILAASEGLPRSHQAYLLATAYHETAATMQPVRETLAATDQAAVNRLERAWKAGKLKSVKTPYWRFDASGKTWLGRGYVQLTHRDNYAKAAALTGVDLLGDPGRAMNPTVAAKILVEGSQVGLFTGKKLSDYLPGDYLGARKIINDTDKAQLIASYAEIFDRALQAAGVSDTPEKTVTEPRIKEVAFTVPGQADTPPPAKKPGAGAVVGTVSLIGVILAALQLWWADMWQKISDAIGSLNPF